MAAHAACESEPRRLEVRLFRYAGTDGDPAKNQFTRFYNIVSEKLLHLRSELAGTDAAGGYLDAMVVKPGLRNLDALYREEPPQTETELKNYYSLYSKSLMLLRGELDLRPGQSAYDVTSYVYFGGAPPAGVPGIIHAEMSISSDAAQHARDSHSLIALFLLGLDAQQRKCDSSTVLNFYQRATKVATDLERKGLLKGHLEQVRDFVRAQIEEAQVGW